MFPIDIVEGTVHPMFADMKCLDLVSHSKTDMMQQLTLRAQTSDKACSWTLQ
jgi:hypothetical protein